MTPDPAGPVAPAAARELRVEHVVDAPVEVVWSTVSDVARMGEWSPEPVMMRALLLGGTDAHADELEAGMARTVGQMAATASASAVGEQGWISRGSGPDAG